MDVRCERCRAEYVVDDARIPEAGVKVGCTQCGHGFLLRKRVLAVAVPLKGGDGETPLPLPELAPASGDASNMGEGVVRGEWRLRQESGGVFPFREISTLQRWIVERKASRDDEVASARDGEAWRRLGDIPELRSFFAVVEKAGRGGEPRPDRGPPETRAAPGMEDPAWASDPGRPARRTTRSLPAVPRRRRRVVWVALLALALLGVAAGTVYLRRGAEAAAEAAAAAKVAAQAKVPPPAVAPPPKPVVQVAVQAATEPTRDSAPPLAPPVGPESTVATAAPAAIPAAAVVPPAAPVATPAAPAPAPAARPAPRDEATSALRTLLAQARDQRDRGRSEAALDLYGRALSIDGRNAGALAGRGACYLDLSRYAQAEASFEAALEADPRNAEALFGLAETCRYMGKKGDAVAWYEKFLAVRPTGDDAAAARRLISQLKE